MSVDTLQTFDISINGQSVGRIIFQLYDDRTPLMARNFRELAIGQHGFGYAGSAILRVIPGSVALPSFIINTSRDGSLYGENLHTPHDKPGLHSMGNCGPGTKISQYSTTTVAALWCDGKNVVFGEVIDGLAIIERIQSYASQDIFRQPSATILVEHSGLF
ncbi:allergen [Lactarius psammicola]|nr:allergen [Lactarius psammicola]